MQAAENKDKRVFCTVSDEIHRRFHIACAVNGSKVQPVLEDFVNTYIDRTERKSLNEEMWALISDVTVRELLRAAYRVLTGGSSRDRRILTTMIQALASKEDNGESTKRS